MLTAMKILLGSTDPTDSTERLNALKPYLPALSVLGLGEPTHGTRESFELKHLIIRYLAEAGWLRYVCFECGLIGFRYDYQVARENPETFRVPHQNEHFDFVAWFPETRRAEPV